MENIGIRKENDNLRINELRLKEEIKKLQLDKEALKKLLRLHGVVSSKTIHSKLANKHESLKGELNSITNIINGNKGMSSDYILDKTRNIPFLRCKLNLIDELLED